MSYVLDISRDAEDGIKQLPFEVQEDTLDLLEWAAANPRKLRRRGTNPNVVCDINVTYEGNLYYVFVTVRPSHSTRTIYVKRVGHLVQLLPPPSQDKP